RDSFPLVRNTPAASSTSIAESRQVGQGVPAPWPAAQGRTLCFPVPPFLPCYSATENFDQQYEAQRKVTCRQPFADGEISLKLVQKCQDLAHAYRLCLLFGCSTVIRTCSLRSFFPGQLRKLCSEFPSPLPCFW